MPASCFRIRRSSSSPKETTGSARKAQGFNLCVYGDAAHCFRSQFSEFAGEYDYSFIVMAAAELVLLIPPREPQRLPESASDLRFLPRSPAQKSTSAKPSPTAAQRAWEQYSALNVLVQAPSSPSGVFNVDEEWPKGGEVDHGSGVPLGESGVVNRKGRTKAQSILPRIQAGFAGGSVSTQFVGVDLTEKGTITAPGKENVVWTVDQTTSRDTGSKSLSTLRAPNGAQEGVEMKKTKVWKSIIDYLKPPPSPGKKTKPEERPDDPKVINQNLSGPDGKIQLHPSHSLTTTPVQYYKKRGPPLPECTLSFLLPPQRPEHANKITLVLDLDETLVHSAFKPVKRPDYIIPVEIDGQLTAVHVLKRPYVDQFLVSLAAHFEIVVFTASLPRYADPLLDLLDEHGTVTHRLFRDACQTWGNNYVKDLRVLGRDLSRTIIIDNSPHSYAFHPENAVPVSSFIDDVADQDLLDLIPFLESVSGAEDVRVWLDQPDFYI